MFVVVVRFLLKPGAEDRFISRVLRQATDSLAAEPACRQFDVCVQPEDRQRVCLYEVYDDDQAFAAHLRSGHFLAFDEETRDWVEVKTVERWTRLAPGVESSA